MSFNTLSAILRGGWLLDKQWADAHMPLVVSFLKGDAIAASIMGEKAIRGKEKSALPVMAAKNIAVYEVCCDDSRIESFPTNSIAMIELSGPLFKNGDYCSYGMADYAELIDRLAASDNVAGILLNIDSPGGQVSGTSLLADSIKAAGTKKPVFGIIDDGIGASAAYWLLSSCNEIWLTQKTSQVGSIGVYTTLADFYAYYASQGLPVRDIYAPQSNYKNNDYREAIKGNDVPLQESLSVLADAFINAVSTNRAGKIKGKDWATGKMYYAEDAKRIGLIDGIKSFEQVVLRMSSLINNQKNNSNTMAFEKTLAAAGAQSFAVVDEGFALTEEQMNAVESKLAEAEQTASSLATATSTIATHEATIDSMTTAATENAATIAAHETKIAELEAKVVELGAKPSGNGSSLTATEDEAPKKDTTTAGGVVIYAIDDPRHPANVAAAKLPRKKSE